MLKRLTMSPFSRKPTCSDNVRSISFPARSHPNMSKLEEELSKLSSLEAICSSKAETICDCLLGLGEVYKSIGYLLDLPLTQKALAQNQDEKWVNDMLDGLICYLDICGKAKDSILLIKERVRELQSALRRSKGSRDFSNIESSVNAYISSRKKMKKDVAKSLASLKQMEDMFVESQMLNSDHYLSLIVRVLKEASLITISIFSSLLLFLSAPILKPKLSKWSLVSKLVHKGVVECEVQQESLNELESVDVALTNLLVHNSSKDLEPQKLQSAQVRLEVLYINIEGFENELECLFRRLIQTRVSLLNIYTSSLE